MSEREREREREIESPHQTDINYKCVCVFLVIDCLTKGNGRRTSQTYCSLIGQPVNIARSLSSRSPCSLVASRRDRGFDFRLKDALLFITKHFECFVGQ